MTRDERKTLDRLIKRRVVALNRGKTPKGDLITTVMRLKLRAGIAALEEFKEKVS